MNNENFNNETSQSNFEEHSSSTEIPGKKKWLLPTVFAVLGICSTILFFKAGELKKLWSNSSADSLKCGMTQTAIYEKYKNSVVLVANSYVYEVKVKGSAPVQFTVTESGELTPYDEHQNNPITITGTGFFVSKDGKLITNRHVASPWTVNSADDITSIKEVVSYKIPDDIEASQIADYIKQHWSEEIKEIDEEWAEVKLHTDTAVAAVDSAAGDISINMPEQKSKNPVDIAEIEVTGKIVRLGIALHNNKVKQIEDFIPCEFISQSDDPNVDVAVIQTISHNLPSKVKNVVDLSLAANDDSAIKPGTKAIMIGYPMGMQLAGTQKGIKVQVYEGEVNKESDGFAVQYNITSTHGASGSPVFNDCGRLIAVNFAGYDQTQGFNFGVVAKYALSLYENE
ncbi:S1 family peptidase [Solitalea lacus]|uniref:S1 family peptidase n=1 Tax=Solitalea lacus TaxID=2911172 RepID=UPI001EDAB5F3|nr:serine protease [Solitalea lacus]UKJ07350.1 serine protease [Solitalea lacus]